MLKVFIGTMKSYEGEFDQCMTSIKSQTGVLIEQFLIEGMREYEAHEKLYRAWEDSKSSFDAFVKVDADMVLKDSTTILRCVELLRTKKQEGYTAVQCPLYDFFLEDMVYGLNCYSTDVVFEKPRSRIYCDRSTKNNTAWIVRSPDSANNDLYPAGSHCSNPSDYQSFMWGYHRGSKNNTSAKEQLLQSINKRRTRQKQIAYAGFRAGEENIKELSYEDEAFMRFYKDYASTV